MNKKILVFIGLMMAGLLVFTSSSLYASTSGGHSGEDEYTGKATVDTIHIKKVTTGSQSGHEAASTSGTGHGAKAARGTGQGKVAEHAKIKPVPVTLADAGTMNLLRTDWLKEAKEIDLSTEKAKLSGTFWAVIAILAVLTILGLVLFAGGAFKRYGLNLKLYTSYGSLVLLAAILGVAGYFYLSSVNGVAHLKAAFMDLDIMASGMQVAQNEFLLHGIENRAYGERQVAKLKHLTKEFAEDTEAIKKSSHLEAEHARRLEELKTAVATYSKDMEIMVKAFADILVASSARLNFEGDL